MGNDIVGDKFHPKNKMLACEMEGIDRIKLRIDFSIDICFLKRRDSIKIQKDCRELRGFRQALKVKCMWK